MNREESIHKFTPIIKSYPVTASTSISDITREIQRQTEESKRIMLRNMSALMLGDGGYVPYYALYEDGPAVEDNNDYLNYDGTRG